MIDDIKVATKMQVKSITDDLAVDEMRAMIKNQACIDGCVFDPKNNLGLSSEDLVKAFFEMFKAKEIQPLEFGNYFIKCKTKYIDKMVTIFMAEADVVAIEQKIKEWQEHLLKLQQLKIESDTQREVKLDDTTIWQDFIKLMQEKDPDTKVTFNKATLSDVIDSVILHKEPEAIKVTKYLTLILEIVHRNKLYYTMKASFTYPIWIKGAGNRTEIATSFLIYGDNGNQLSDSFYRELMRRNINKNEVFFVGEFQDVASANEKQAQESITQALGSIGVSEDEFIAMNSDKKIQLLLEKLQARKAQDEKVLDEIA